MKKRCNNYRNSFINYFRSSIIKPLRSTWLYVAVFAFSTSLFSVNHSLHAATINVPADFTTIQAAVDSAISGDTIKVAAGTYFESITMKDGVDIEGAGIDVTTISGNTGSTVIGADDAIISGFLLTNNSNASGVFCDNTSTTIMNCRISECPFSGIVCVNGGSPVIKNNIIDNNGGSFTGGSANDGINVWDSTGSVTILNNTIFGNQRYGIAAVRGGASVIVRNNSIYDNSIAGINIWCDAVLDITNNTIYGNRRHGISNGCSGNVASSVTIINNIIMSNSSNGIGLSGSPSMSFNDVFDNGTNYSNVDPGFGDISEDPLFLDAENADFHFLAATPARDAGDPTITDPDGSRSDLGAFGGPGTLEESTIFGPIVKDIIVTPNPVAKGQSITVRASAEAQ